MKPRSPPRTGCGSTDRGAGRRPAGADDPSTRSSPSSARSGRSSSSSTAASMPNASPRLRRTGSAQITRLAGVDEPATARGGRGPQRLQRYFVDGTRLGIPAVVHEECLHGLMARDAPCFQQSIGAAATLDPRSWSSVARHDPPADDADRGASCARPRPGHRQRSALGAARGDVRRGSVPGGRHGPRLHVALQGDSLTDGVVATGKHLIGHGLAEGGLNMAPAHLGPRQLRDEQLFPFEVAVRRAGIGSVMPAYCDVDGVPCHASAELLTDDPPRRMGLRRVVASDYIGIAMLATHHRMTADDSTAAALAWRPASTSSCRERTCSAGPCWRALEDGRMDERLSTAPWRRPPDEVPAGTLRGAVRRDPASADMRSSSPTRRLARGAR